jgi:hypothetical protein
VPEVPAEPWARSGRAQHNARPVIPMKRMSRLMFERDTRFRVFQNIENLNLTVKRLPLLLNSKESTLKRGNETKFPDVITYTYLYG